VKDLKEKIVINVWDKDTEKDPMTFSKFFRDEKDDFLGTVLPLDLLFMDLI